MLARDTQITRKLYVSTTPPMRSKRLEWRSGSNGKVLWFVGDEKYRIRQIGTEVYADQHNVIIHEGTCVDAAKAACQADFDTYWQAMSEPDTEANDAN
jgi:hypothetical protein